MWILFNVFASRKLRFSLLKFDGQTQRCRAIILLFEGLKSAVNWFGVCYYYSCTFSFIRWFFLCFSFRSAWKAGFIFLLRLLRYVHFVNWRQCVLFSSSLRYLRLVIIIFCFRFWLLHTYTPCTWTSIRYGTAGISCRFYCNIIVVRG